MDILKIAAMAIITAVLALIVKQYKPEYSVFIQLSGIVAVTLLAVSFIGGLTAAAGSMLSFAGLDAGYLKVLMKVLGVAVITEFGSDICKDNGNTALAGSVELAGKIVILTLSLPMIKAIAELAAGLINA